MGDRCYMTITFRKEDRKKVIEHMEEFDEEDDSNKNTITGTMYEANYGMYTERQDLANDDIAFHGNHGAGGDYPEAVFASCGKDYADTHAIDGFPAVRVREEGADASDMEEAKKYYRVIKKALTHFSMKPGIYAAKMKEP